MTLFANRPAQDFRSLQILFQGFEVLAVNAGDGVSRKNVLGLDDPYPVFDGIQPEADHVSGQFFYSMDPVQKGVFHGNGFYGMYFVGHDGDSYEPRLLDENYSTVLCTFQDSVIGQPNKKNGYFLSKIEIDSFTRPKFAPCQGVSDEEPAQFLLVVCVLVQRDSDLGQIVGVQDDAELFEEKHNLPLDNCNAHKAPAICGWNWFWHNPSFHKFRQPVSESNSTAAREHKGQFVKDQGDLLTVSSHLEEGSGIYGHLFNHPSYPFTEIHSAISPREGEFDGLSDDELNSIGGESDCDRSNFKATASDFVFRHVFSGSARGMEGQASAS